MPARAPGEGLLSATRPSAGCHAQPAGEGKLTILIEGVFTPKAKKAFKRRRIAVPPPCSKPGFSGAKLPPAPRRAGLANSHRGWVRRRRRGYRKLTIR